MSQTNETGIKTFKAAAALAPGLRVKITDATTNPPTVNVAGAADVAIGTVERRALAASDDVAIRLRTKQGTCKMVAADAITCGNPVYGAAAGKISNAGTVYEGVALEASTTNLDVIEVCPMPNVDIPATISTTNAATFEVDADASTPKIALAAQTAGTGNFTTTLKPEATLSADTYVILPETADGDTLMARGMAETVTGAKTFTGRIAATGNVGNTAGVGITGTATSFVTAVEKVGTLIRTTILVDLQALNSGGTANDIIGANGAGVAHLGQITAAVNGTIISGRLTCLETPATGDNDIDLYSATEATGVEDTAISALVETQLCNSGDLTAGTVVAVTPPAADQYLYLVGVQGDCDATYSAGILLIELWGK